MPGLTTACSRDSKIATHQNGTVFRELDLQRATIFGFSRAGIADGTIVFEPCLFMTIVAVRFVLRLATSTQCRTII
jgi:hypothetical protein